VPEDDQSVTVHLAFRSGGFGTEEERRRVLQLEDALSRSMTVAGVGHLDGDGFGDGGADIFANGPDAEELYSAMEADLRSFGPMVGSFALLVFGLDEDSPVRTIDLANSGAEGTQRWNTDAKVKLLNQDADAAYAAVNLVVKLWRKVRPPKT
jgi:hypothetical protein